MQFTSALLTFALAATALASPTAVSGGPSARNEAAKVRRTYSYCPSEVTITTIAPDGSNNVCYAPVNNHWQDITHSGPHPELSISQVTWTSFDYVECAFIGVDTKHGAGPVLSEDVVDTKFGKGFNVGPPQTLEQVRCWCI